MARVTDVPAEHRRLAEQMPADIRERIDPAELRLRLAEVTRLRDRVGDMPDHETARGLAEHAEAMLKALPFCELEDRCRDLTQTALGTGAAVDRGGFLQAAAQLKHKNPQPMVMTQAARLADTYHGVGHLAASTEPDNRRLAAAAEMIRAQRAAIKASTATASPAAAPAARKGPARERYEAADLTKGEQVEEVAFLRKGVTRAVIVKAVQDAYAAVGIDERLDEVAAEIGRTRAHMAGRTRTTGEPVTKTRGTS